MKVLRLFFLFSIVASLNGCVQKYPTAYGIYLLSGGSWLPIETSDKELVVPSNPVFLVFDPRLASSAGKPDTLITLKPLKWLRWNINALVVERNDSPHLYQKNKIKGFVPHGQIGKLAFSPVKTQPSMLLVSPTSPLSDGYFLLNVLGTKVLCRNKAVADPERLPDSHKVDVWSKSFDTRKADSWDAFLVQSVNQGRSTFSETVEPVGKLTALIDTLQRDLSTLVSKKDSLPLIAFCKKIEKLDSEMYFLAKKQCQNAIKEEMTKARLDSDFPLAIGVGRLSYKLGFADDLILKELAVSTRDLAAAEKVSQKKADELQADIANPGLPVMASEYVESNFLSKNFHKYVLTDTQIVDLENNKSTYGCDGWMGNIREMVTGERWKKPIMYIYPSSLEGRGQLYFAFDAISDRDNFFNTTRNVWSAWRKKWADHLSVEITARPYCWSHKIFAGDISYVIEPINGSANIVIADVEVGSAFLDKDGKQIGGELHVQEGQYEKYLGISYPRKQFRIRSEGNSSVSVRVRFCPLASEKELAMLKSRVAY